MGKNEMIEIAKVAIRKRLDYETLLYSDYLYGKEQHADDIWEFVAECDQIGQAAFIEKYGALKIESVARKST